MSKPVSYIYILWVGEHRTTGSIFEKIKIKIYFIFNVNFNEPWNVTRKVSLLVIKYIFTTLSLFVVCSKILDCIDKRTLGKGFLALLISSWTIKKIYAQIQILKNVKKIELKRKETDRRKRSLEERWSEKSF